MSYEPCPKCHLSRFYEDGQWGRCKTCEEHERINNNTSVFKTLEDHLTHFDWTYQYSDDNRCYRSGEVSLKIIKELITVCKTIDEQRTKEIVERLQYGGYDEPYSGIPNLIKFFNEVKI